MQRSTMAQAESTRYKPFGGIAVRRACHSVVRFSMADGTKGCEVVSRSRQHTQMATLWSRSSTLNMQDMAKLISLKVPRKTLQAITLETG